MHRPVLALELAFVFRYRAMDLRCRVSRSHHLFYTLSPNAAAILPDYSCCVDIESNGFSSTKNLENIMSINVDSSLEGKHNIFMSINVDSSLEVKHNIFFADSVLKSSSNACVIKRLFRLHSISCKSG